MQSTTIEERGAMQNLSVIGGPARGDGKRRNRRHGQIDMESIVRKRAMGAEREGKKRS